MPDTIYACAYERPCGICGAGANERCRVLDTPTPKRDDNFNRTLSQRRKEFESDER